MTGDDGRTEPHLYVRWAFPLLGWSMIGHFVFLLARTSMSGSWEDLFWISHIGTLLGGLGALYRNHRLISVSLVALFSHHLFWAIDTLGWLLSGKFPLGTTTYLADATLGGWLQSANHFFSVPALLLLAYWQNGVDRHAWLGSTILFAFLALISYFFLSPEANVNSVYRLWPGLDRTPLIILQQLPERYYLAIMVILNGIGNYWPTNIILRGMYAIVRPQPRIENNRRFK